MNYLKSNTERARRMIENYHCSTMYSLYDLYSSFSKRKSDAWEYCLQLCYKHNGRGLKVVGGNTCQFSAGFVFEDGKQKLCYITKSNNYVIDLE